MTAPPSNRFDTWSLRTAEQLEGSVGAWVALASYKRLFEAPSPLRERAILGAMRCALSLGGSAEVGLTTDLWAKADARFVTDEPLRIALRELTAGRERFALLVLDAERERLPSATTAYAVARVYGATREAWPATEAGMLEKAQALAGDEGDAALRAACAARRLEILEEDARKNPDARYRREATAIVEGVDAGSSSDAVKVVVARAQLLAAGRFVRASALSTLGDVVRRGGEGGLRAAHTIGRHVDAMGARLTQLEAERALAGLAALEDEAARDEALARARAVIAAGRAEGAAAVEAARAAAALDPETAELALRARALASGAAMTSHGSDRFADPFVVLAALGLDALGALATDKVATASLALDAAAPRVGPGEAIPTPLWSATWAALAARGLARDAAVRLAARLVARAAGEPPFGFLALGEALAAAGAGDASRLALDLAKRGREPGAVDALVRSQTAAAWRAYDAGDAPRARALLREAQSAAAGR